MENIKKTDVKDGKTQGTPILKSVDKAFKLFDCFTGEKQDYTLVELSRKLSISKGTVHRILLTAQKRGMIEQNPETGRYRLGMKVFELGNVVARRMDLRSESLPILKRISEETGLVSYLIVENEDTALCIECVQGKSLLRFMFLDVGKRMPFYIGAGPRVLLAGMRDEKINFWLKKQKLKPWTENTITDPEVLKEDIKKTREQGYALSIEDVTIGSAAAAVPIWGADGEVAGAISIAGATANFQGEKLEQYIRVIKDAGIQLSERMGWKYQL